MAAVPDFGLAARVEQSAPPGAEATQDLFERFGSQIYGYCLHQLGSREEAEDAVQTTFMNVFRGLQRGIVPRVEGAWLFKIAHNVCLSRRRSTRRRGRVETPNNFEVLQDVVPAREGSTDELIRLHDALEGMPDMQRRAILLREWRGFSYREIADELRLSQAAVETLIFRARRTLAAGLGENGKGSVRKRARYGIDASGLLAAAKTIFGGGTTVKVAATVAAVATTAIASAEVSQHHRRALNHARTSRAALPSTVLRAAAKRATVHHRAARPVAAKPGRVVTRSSHAPVSNAPSALPPHVLPRESVEVPPAVERAPAPVAAAPSPAAPVSVMGVPTRTLQPASDDVGTETQAPVTPPTPAKVNPGRGHAKHDDGPAAPVAPGTQPQPAPADAAAPQASEQHGRETAPGQQTKPDNPGNHKGKGP